MTAALQALRSRIAADHRLGEAEAVGRLLCAQPDPGASKRITSRAIDLAARVRAAPRSASSAESFLAHHGLATREGVALMCLAEALLRIPDAETQDALLREKLASGEWSSASAADWTLLLTGKLMQWHDDPSALKSVLSRLGEPVVRGVVRQAMRLLGGQFVIAQTIGQAVACAAALRPARFSFDMLGEAARGAEDAEGYFRLYLEALNRVTPPDGISVKLSALHPRFEEAKRARVLAELLPRLKSLAGLAKRRGIGVTIDAEESERLELTLDLLEALVADSDGLGLAVQAYQKRAPAVCEWLVQLGRASRKRIPVRLVKGAYWDGEVKRAQVLGMPDYPVYTRREATDLCYVACARTLLEAPEAIVPAFATHNCRTVATILELAGKDSEFEFQKLFGMGDALYRELASVTDVACRTYAPVGNFTELLPYLVRRLLENGANTSFVHQILDPAVPLERLVADPVSALPQPYAPHERIPLPRDLYGDRRNSLGVDLARRDELARLAAVTQGAQGPVSESVRSDVLLIREPGNLARPVGTAPVTSPAQLDAALDRAARAFADWSRRSAAERAAVLERAAEAFEADMADLVSLVVREGGRCYPDAVSEVREAADFCRYYALQARKLFESPLFLKGPAGEDNRLLLHGRGVFACISPWNFPLAIFTGQVAAALAAGNGVIAKPAEQTPLTALRALEILQSAGVPANAAIGAFGTGEAVGAPLVADPRIAGVAFTGSVETARRIHRALAARDGPIVPLIAETGGVNAMIADSSALPEQLVDDVLVSAFQSAGQRCSALRILFLEEGAAARVLRLLAGAMRELKVGDPVEPDTDIGPVIDEDSRAVLSAYIEKTRSIAAVAGETALPSNLPEGFYVAPVAFRMDLQDLPREEIFGPVLHIHVYRRTALDDVLAWIRGTGFGLTLGIHSRVRRFADEVARNVRAGNVYVNRSMIGAAVGVQPFGGEGLSGTGPKAGGPNYLPRFAAERTITVNTAAVGGVTELLAPAEDRGVMGPR